MRNVHGPGRTLGRRTLIATSAALALGMTLGACTDGDRSDEEQLRVDVADGAPGSMVLPGDDVAGTALTLSSLLFAASDVVVVATAETAEALAAVSAGAGLPLLIGTEQAVAEEIARLGAGTVVTATGTDLTSLGEDLEVVEIDPADASATLPEVVVDQTPTSVRLLVDPDQPAPAAAVARAQVEAAGGTVGEVPGGDPRRSSATVAAAREAAGQDPATGVIALGESFGGTEQWIGRLQTAVTVPELPGGGQVAFPHRRMVAAYGTPGAPALGILGEQGLEESIARVQQLAAEYQEFSAEPVIPAFEVITTIASAEAGRDGDYSRPIDPEELRPWVDAAGEAGVYVVLDLQPGTTDFLTQAQLYEELLKEPHVGLALDPEWRLKPGQRHMVQIGSVSAQEVNATSQWLADLTAEHSLPQKVFILHQFNLSMISDRQDVDTSRPELAITLHADGHGNPGDKLATWNALQRNLPEGIFMAWKNFYDEDSPTFTPQETYELEPKPWFVSYQ